MSLKEIVLKAEPSALMYKLSTALPNGQNGLNGVPALLTQLENV